MNDGQSFVLGMAIGAAVTLVVGIVCVGNGERAYDHFTREIVSEVHLESGKMIIDLKDGGRVVADKYTIEVPDKR